MRPAHEPADQSIPVASHREPVAKLIVGTVAAAVAGILGLGAIVYYFTGPDTPEQTAAATADATEDDSQVFTQEAAGPGATAGAAATEQVAVPGATTTPAQQGVTAGAFCSPIGATGKTSTGLSLRCIRALGDSRARWRTFATATTTAPTTKPTTKPTTTPATKPTTTPATKPTTTKPTTAPTTQTPTTAPTTDPTTAPAAGA
ncbi:hypothetical protein [Actinoplanes sp. NPDC026619]|uniref:hypothetical protein n=1 Tax=Actinoplanes sp. NPDC026619 TaxID=3155798 RepID=UPI0033E0DFD7